MTAMFNSCITAQSQEITQSENLHAANVYVIVYVFC